MATSFLGTEVTTYVGLLHAVEAAFTKHAPTRQSGVVRTREETLTTWFAECLRQHAWAVTREPSFAATLQGDQRRADLVARKGTTRIWLEARWWWQQETLPDVLEGINHDERMRRCPAGHRALALLFTAGNSNRKSRWYWARSPDRTFRRFVGRWSRVALDVVQPCCTVFPGEMNRSEDACFAVAIYRFTPPRK
jgi:hypothetical protein